MKIAILSDLHWETQEFNPLSCLVDDFDILIAAGDIVASTSNKCPIDMLSDLSQGKPVLYVLGNHEYETLHINQAVDRFKKRAEGTCVKVLDNEIIKIDDVNFIGSTLWSSFSLPDTDFEENIENAKLIQDFHHQRQDGSRLTIDEVLTLNFHALDFIKNSLNENKDEKNIVITHFAPHLNSIAKKFEGNLSNSWFVNNVGENIIKMANLWIHGHTHTSFDYKVGSIPNKGRVVCNPQGFSHTIKIDDYPKEFRPLILRQYPDLKDKGEKVLFENEKYKHPLIINTDNI